MISLCPQLDTTMKKEQDIENKEARNLKLLKPVFDEISYYLLRHDIKFNEVVNMLSNSYIDSARLMGKKNASSISLKTGIDRRQIPAYADLIKNNIPRPHFKPSPLLMVLRDLRIYQKKTKLNTIHLKGMGDSLVNICNKYKGRLTAPTIIKELFDIGCIKNKKQNEVEIIRTSMNINQTQKKEFNRVSNQMSRLMNTLRKNHENPETKVVEWSIQSTQISSENRKQLANDIAKVRDNLRLYLLEVFEKYESKETDEHFSETFSINFFVNSK